MPNIKSLGAIIFYIFIIVFIVLAYLNNNGTFASLFPKTTTVAKKNIIQIEYKDKEYVADYTKKSSGMATEIAGFEEGEKWGGDYRIDDVNYWEGKSSYVVLSRNHSPAVLTLRKSLNLSDSTVIKLLVYSANQQNTDNIQKTTLRLGNLNDSAYYEYDIRNIKPGWNVIEMLKENFSLVSGSGPAKEESTPGVGSEQINTSSRLWGAVEKISLVVDSRPNTQTELSFDRLWTEKDESYKKEFLSANFDMVSPRVWNGKSYINVWGLGSTLSLINKVSGVRDFTYTAKIIPQKTGTFGINGRTDLSTSYGYFLELGGVGTGTWRLYKYGKVVDVSVGPVTELDSGGIANYQIETNQPLWLRLSTAGNSIAGYLSTDGKNFTKLTEKSDSELVSGGIGIQTAASFLLESVEFKQ